MHPWWRAEVRTPCPPQLQLACLLSSHGSAPAACWARTPRAHRAGLDSRDSKGCAGTYFDVAISAVFGVLFVLTWNFACARLATTVVNTKIRARLRWAQAVFTLAPVVLVRAPPLA